MSKKARKKGQKEVKVNESEVAPTTLVLDRQDVLNNEYDFLSKISDSN